MTRPIDAARLAAVRALREGAAQTYALLAGASGIHETTLREHASREKWDKVNYLTVAAMEARRRLNAVARGQTFARDSDEQAEAMGWGLAPDEEQVDFDALEPVELLARAGGFVARQVTRLMQHAERRGGRLDKAQIDGLAALSRMMDRWETLAHERAKKEETESDADLSEALRWINERIVALARGEAERIAAAAGDSAPGDGTGA